jgi:hemolysin III
VATEQIPDVRLRPRTRGWIHYYSAMVAFVVGIALVVVAAQTRDGRAVFACSVYAVTLVGLFAVSATYHRHAWISATARTWMKRADHSMIFVFIAGTYTPYALLGLPPGAAGWLLAVVWTGALAGVALKMGWPHSPRWLGVPLYIALGWAAVFIIPALVESVGAAPVVLMCAGGLFYTGGAVMYALRKPDPWPGTFGYHEFFHACVSLAALCHCLGVWLVLVR